jgi:hypothetical protein
MNKYRVKIPVFAEIEVFVFAKNKTDAETKAINKAVESEPLTCWEIDSLQNIEVRVCR